MKQVKQSNLVVIAALALTGLWGAPAASGSELYSGSTTLGTGTEITATLQSGSSMLLKDTVGGANDTCTSSEVKGKIESVTPTSHPKGKVSSLTFGGCSHTTTVLANGTLEVKNIAGTTNGTVTSTGARVTIKSTLFGISCVANTGSGTTMGTLTGAEPGEQPVIDINAVITLENGCGDSILTGTYLVTGPTSLLIETSGPPISSELYKSTAPSDHKLGTGAEITATQKSGSSFQLKDTEGVLVDTCTGSELKGKVENAGGESSNPTGKVESMTFSGCSHTTTVLANGALEVKTIAGTTNGTLMSKGARITVKLTVLGISCVVNTGEGTTLGTLTGSATGGQATIDVNAVVSLEGICGDAALTGTYLVTTPTGLIVEGAGSGAELYQRTPVIDTQGIGTEIIATTQSGSSMLLKDTLGGANDTCTTSEIKGKIERAGGEGSNPSGKLETLTFGGCSHTTTVLAKGSLKVKNVAGTTNGTVISKEARITVKSTIFGISCVAATGAGTTIGTLTGAGPGKMSAIDLNGVITLENGCNDSTLTGTYLVTSPTGLVSESA